MRNASGEPMSCSSRRSSSPYETMTLSSSMMIMVFQIGGEIVPQCAQSLLWYSLSQMSPTGDAQELESELAAANKAIENLIKELTANESRANALSENAWRWVFRYRRIQKDYLAPVYKALRRL